MIILRQRLYARADYAGLNQDQAGKLAADRNARAAELMKQRAANQQTMQKQMQGGMTKTTAMEAYNNSNQAALAKTKAGYQNFRTNMGLKPTTTPKPVGGGFGKWAAIGTIGLGTAATVGMMGHALSGNMGSSY